jgi:lysophospholipase L1-like esterase
MSAAIYRAAHLATRCAACVAKEGALNHKRLLSQVMGLVVAGLLLAACGAPQPTPTPVPPTPPPTLTPVPPTPTSASALPEWDYIALGDYMVGMYDSFAVPYAAHIEADLGVKVRLNKSWARAVMTSGALLGRLRTNQNMRDAISEAEIVTLVIGGNDLIDPMEPDGHGGCDGEDTTDCLRDRLESFRVNYDAIIAELFTLCSPKTIIRTMTYYYGSLADYGFDGDLRPFYGPVNDHVIQAASEHNIPVALVHLAFNGPDGNEDPADKGYLSDDGLHPNEVGAALIADLHRELGYEFTCP